MGRNKNAFDDPGSAASWHEQGAKDYVMGRRNDSPVYPKNMEELKAVLHSWNDQFPLWRVSLRDMPDQLDFTDLFSALDCKRTDFRGMEKWDMSKVRYANSMFAGRRWNCVPDLSKWDVSNIESAEGMFAFSPDFDADLSGLNWKSLTNGASMFEGCRGFSGKVSGWNCPGLQDASNMFKDCATLQNPGFENWKPLLALHKAIGMFDGCVSFNGLLPPVGEKCEIDGSWMLSGCISWAPRKFSRSAENLKKSFLHHLYNASHAFEGCVSFDGSLLAFSCPDSLTDATQMFSGCVSLSADLSNLEFPKKYAKAFSGCGIMLLDHLPEIVQKNKKSRSEANGIIAGKYGLF